MTRAVLYVAHCLRPSEDEIEAIEPFTISRGRGEYELDAKIWKPHKTRVNEALLANLDRAMRWLSWLHISFPETTFIAPWIAAVLSGEDDADPKQREMGLVDACAVIERCDGIVLCGPRISEGMRRKMEHGKAFWAAQTDHPVREEDFAVYNLTGKGVEYIQIRLPPGSPFVRWAPELERALVDIQARQREPYA